MNSFLFYFIFFFRNTSLRGLQTLGKHLSNLTVMEMGKFQEKNLEWYENKFVSCYFFPL